MPLVSVVIPTYKHRDLVPLTLASVFDQTLARTPGDVEVIVVDDGSPDGTADVLRPMAAAGKIRLVEQPNAGQSAARNRGLAEARGRYVALLDDDDLWPADKLAWQVEALEAEPAAGLVYGYAAFIGTGPADRWPPTASPADAPRGRVWADLFGVNPIYSPGQTLIRADLLRSVGGLDAALWGTDDWDLYIRLAAVAAFAYRDRPALQYRVHAANASHDLWRMHANIRRVRRKHLGVLPGPRTLGAWRNWLRFDLDARRRYAAVLAVRARNADAAAPQGSVPSADWGRAARLWPVLLRKPAVVKRITRRIARRLFGLGPRADAN